MLTKEEVYAVIPRHILFKMFDTFPLGLGQQSIHGIYHWGRVIENGIRMADFNKANKKVLIAFGFFHDIKREIDGDDPKHGYRASVYLENFKNDLNLTKEEFEKLKIACEGHNYIIHHNDLDIGTCWDSDRLDLGRDYIYPDKKRLNNDFPEMDELIALGAIRGGELYMPFWCIDIHEDYISEKEGQLIEEKDLVFAI